MFELFIIKEDDKSRAIRNPDLNSSCCDSLHAFPQVHHLLPVSGSRQPFLELGAEGYQLCPACWKAHPVRQEEPKEQAHTGWRSSLHSKNSTSFHSCSVGRRFPCSGREDTRHPCKTGRWWQADLRRRSSGEARHLRKATWKPASWLSDVIKDKIWNASEEGETGSQVWVA